jgi:competence protein ComEC
MLLKWTPIPLVRIATVFCGGILLAIYQFGIISMVTAITIFVVALGLFLVIFNSQVRGKKYLSGLFGFIYVFCCGYLLVAERTDSREADNLLHIKDPILAYEGFIQDHLYERKNSFKTLVTVKHVKTQGGWRKATGKVNLYIAKKTLQNNIRWGNRVLITRNPNEVQPPANPHEFDFKRFLTFKNIYHQHFVQGTDIIWLGETQKDFFYYSAQARRFFSSIITEYVSGEQEQAIALALVIGVTDGIDNELENAYSASGAMHVLAVSGLHIGILYSIILFFLKPMQRTQRGQWMVAVISLMLLWGYSFVTGLSPSVLRAVTMFSFIAAAKPLNIRSNIFNTLAGSAIILLLFDPYLIMSVGFQLSYLAVLGIIWIQRPLYLLWEAKTWLMDQVWQITCVSIAAQLTTFSLGLLYFHQFPTYFLFSNLFVIPISFCVLVVGIVLLVVSFIAPLAKLVGWLLWGFVKLLNEGVFLTERLPYSLVNHIYIDVFQSWLIMGIVTGLIFTFQFKNIRWLYAAFGLAVVLAGARWVHQLDRLSESKLIVYNITGVSAVELIGNGTSQLYSDSSFMADAERVRFHIRPNRLYNLVGRSDHIDHLKIDKDDFRLLNYSGKRILILHRKFNSVSAFKYCDIIVVSGKAAWQMPELLKTNPSAKIILDSSWGRGQINWLRKQKLDLSRIHIVPEAGAYMIDFIESDQ